MPHRIDPKTLRKMSDAELEAEARRRRRERAQGASRRSSAGSERRWLDETEAAQVLQWYANLELAPGARLDDIEEAYARLSRSYHPDRHRDDPERRKAAETLLARLTAAREGLIAYAKRRS